MKNHKKQYIEIQDPIDRDRRPLKIAYLYKESEAGEDEKKTLILLHGLWGSVFCWRDVFDELSAHHTVYAPDLPGHGDSEKRRVSSLSPMAQTLYVSEFVKEHNIGRAVFVGNSLGGGISLLMAHYFSSLVSKLILLSPACYNQGLPKNIRRLRNPFLRIPFYFVSPKFFMRKALPRIYHNRELITDEVVEGHSYPLTLKGAKSAFIKSARELIPPDIDEFEQQIPLIKKKTLIVWGEEDRITPPSHAGRLHREISGSTLEMIPDCGHAPQEEKPETVTRLILDFVKKE
jgi:pimeloyl-ACP methyl ester carboxylesterase